MELFNWNTHGIKMWNDIIRDEGFYPDEVYYDMTGEKLPYKQNEKWKELTKEEQDKRMVSSYGIRSSINPEMEEKGYIIYNDDGKIIAWILWAWNINKLTAHLKYIIVIENEQKKGLGKKLMDIFIEWCIENKITTASLSFNQAENLKKFYGTYGFKNYNLCINNFSCFTTWKRYFKYKTKILTDFEYFETLYS